MIMGEEVPFRTEEEDECTYYTINSENEEEFMTPVKMKRKRTPSKKAVIESYAFLLMLIMRRNLEMNIVFQ